MVSDSRDADEAYRATRAAVRDGIWDVVGTLAMAVFFGIAAVVGLWVLGTGALSLLDGPATLANVGLTALGVAVLAGAGWRLWAL